MVTSILSIFGALLTILGPVLAAGLLAWLDKKHSERIHETIDTVDEHITQHLVGNPGGIVNLSRQLERLHREASRKHRHP